MSVSGLKQLAADAGELGFSTATKLRSSHACASAVATDLVFESASGLKQLYDDVGGAADGLRRARLGDSAAAGTNGASHAARAAAGGGSAGGAGGAGGVGDGGGALSSQPEQPCRLPLRPFEEWLDALDCGAQLQVRRT
eukprot:6187033-Pleurochrysis_carterae.AAC.2